MAIKANAAGGIFSLFFTVETWNGGGGATTLGYGHILHRNGNKGSGIDPDDNAGKEAERVA